MMFSTYLFVWIIYVGISTHQGIDKNKNRIFVKMELQTLFREAHFNIIVVTSLELLIC